MGVKLDYYIVWDNKVSDPEETKYDYIVGEVITVNSVDKYKCVDKKIVGNKVFMYFKKGIITFNY